MFDYLLSPLFAFQQKRKRRSRYRACRRVERLEHRNLLAANVLDLEAAVGKQIDVTGIGLSDAGEVRIVGNTTEARVTKAWLLELAADRQTLASQNQLSGLGSNTPVMDISNNGRFMVGFSRATNSAKSEGLIWREGALSDPTMLEASGDGFSTFASSVANNGISVGASEDTQVIGRWGPDGTLEPLEDQGIGGMAFAVSADGETVAGTVASARGAVMEAAIWEANGGLELLEDPYGLQSIAMSISPDGDQFGGYTTEFDFDSGTFTNWASVWDAAGEITILTNSAGVPIAGKVSDISESGWIVGSTIDGHGFIGQNPNDIMLFDDWLLDQHGVSLNTPSTSIDAIIEDPARGQILFLVEENAYFVSADMPGFNRIPEWQNPSNPLDVDDDLRITPLDALLVIQALNRYGSGALPARSEAEMAPPFPDTNGDHTLEPRDALKIINRLNRRDPAILLRLENDTGSSRYDLLTNDPTIQGRIISRPADTVVYVGLDGTSRTERVAYSGTFDDDAFTLTPSFLTTLADGTLSEGTHTIDVELRSLDGEQLTVQSLDWTLTA